jgi:methylated-DNA-protein-cysteine methyltransferase-like protein
MSVSDTFEQIYAIVRRIPFGCAATYGQIARMAGNPRLSRIVGCAMHSAPDGVPCHRVVNRFGGLCDAFQPLGKETHRLLLEMEGVGFLEDGNVDLERYQWKA